jgi:enoyl-CoA hydratase/carnithine racemase
VRSDILINVSDGVGTITLNRPDRRNAFSHEMLEGLAVALEQMEVDPSVGAIVLTGAGGAFCSGGDAQGFHESGGEGGGATVVDEAAVDSQRRFQEETVGRLYRCAKPVLASIPGAVAGAGIGLVNWIVAEEDLEAKTRELAIKLASGPSHALSGMKQNLLRASADDLTASMYAEVPLHKATGLTDDHVNAVKAFVDKEIPTFPVGWHTTEAGT